MCKNIGVKAVRSDGFLICYSSISYRRKMFFCVECMYGYEKE